MDNLVVIATIAAALIGLIALIITALDYFRVDPNSRHVKVGALASGLVMVLIAVGGGGYLFGRSVGDKDELRRKGNIERPSAPSVEILSPEPDDAIPYKNLVKGTASGLEPGQVVWLLDRDANEDPRGDVYSPHDHPCPIGEDGTWQCENVFIGVEGDSKRDTPKRYEIVAVLADGHAQNKFIDYHYAAAETGYHGIGIPPEGVYVPPVGSTGRFIVSRDIEQQSIAR
jgi:hypothetical protein